MPGRAAGVRGGVGRYGRPMGARGWSGVRGAVLGVVGGMSEERVCGPAVGLRVGAGGASVGRGGGMRRRLVVSGSVWARPAGRQGATGGWWAGSGGRSGRGRGVVGPPATGGASGRRAEEGGGGGAMGPSASRDGARRCGNRGGAASFEALGVRAGAAGAPGGVEAGVTEPDALPDAPGVRPDMLAASPVARGPRPALSAPFSPAPGAPCATRVSPAVPSVAPVPSVTGGSVGGGGVAGRGGMEARRASVLMHPPFPRTGAGPAESVRRGTRPSRARIPARAYRHPGAYLRARWLLPA
ncbi:hypothetical protein T45_03342 [Streptomyces turgidiscabies]|nr:hypothetical protein T45_03342 [Streptomyces turgidiscabies]